MLRATGTTGAVGMEIALAISVGYFGGEYLDGRFDSTPWLKWIGFAGGVGASIKALMRVTRHYNRAIAQTEGDSLSDGLDSADNETRETR